MDIPRRKLAFVPVTVVGAALLIGAGTLVVLMIPKSSENTVNLAGSELQTPDPMPVQGNMNLMFAGTTFWGRNTNKMARASNLGVKYPFSELSTLNRGDYDAWIAGLECPITDKGHSDYNENTLLLFNCDPDYLSEAANWFTAFSLGNNHTDNMGTDGFATTKKYLTEAGIQYFGHYDYRNTDQICQPVVLPMRLEYSDGSEQAYDIPMGLCGIHGVFGVPTEAALQVVKEYSKIMPTIVMPHMGAEYKAESDTLRQNIYRKLIDYGAEMVLGDHPHWIQNTEAYKGKLIVYSMGNFMFDQLWSAETSRATTIEATATFEKEQNFEDWAELGEQCEDDRASCLQNIKEANLPRLDVDWDFDYHGTISTETRIPRLAGADEQAAIGTRLNWANTIKNLD
ncbi:MAG: CapA family protein [Candidatus Saccharimonadales bacterium]